MGNKNKYTFYAVKNSAQSCVIQLVFSLRNPTDGSTRPSGHGGPTLLPAAEQAAGTRPHQAENSELSVCMTGAHRRRRAPSLSRSPQTLAASALRLGGGGGLRRAGEGAARSGPAGRRALCAWSPVLSRGAAWGRGHGRVTLQRRFLIGVVVSQHPLREDNRKGLIFSLLG